MRFNGSTQIQTVSIAVVGTIAAASLVIHLQRSTASPDTERPGVAARTAIYVDQSGTKLPSFFDGLPVKSSGVPLPPLARRSRCAAGEPRAAHSLLRSALGWLGLGGAVHAQDCIGCNFAPLNTYNCPNFQDCDPGGFSTLPVGIEECTYNGAYFFATCNGCASGGNSCPADPANCTDC